MSDIIIDIEKCFSTNSAVEIVASKVRAFNRACLVFEKNQTNITKGAKTRTYNQLVEALILFGVPVNNVTQKIAELVANLDGEVAQKITISATAHIEDYPYFEGQEEWFENQLPLYVEEAKTRPSIKKAMRNVLTAEEKYEMNPTTAKKAAITRTKTTLAIRVWEELNLIELGQRKAIAEVLLHDSDYINICIKQRN